MPHEVVGIVTSEFDAPGSMTVDRCADFLKKHYPSQWKRVYTKQIQSPGTHYGFKLPATALVTALAHQAIGRIDGPYSSMRNYLAAEHLLHEFDYPTFYVSEPLLAALLHTHPPKDLTWESVPMPFQALIIMLPRNTIREPDGKNVDFLIVARMPSAKERGVGAPVRLSNTATIQFPEAPRIMIMWAVDNGFTSQSVVFPASDKLEPSAKWIADKTHEVAEKFGLPEYHGPESEFSSYLAGIVANVLLVKAARPKLMTPAEKVGTFKNKATSSVIPVYRPNFIGEKYAVRRGDEQGRQSVPTGAHFTELRWRSGHLKAQPYGQDRAERKIIFVDPYICYGAGLKLA